MSKIDSKWINPDEVRSQVNQFFEKELVAIGLGKGSLGRQSEKALRRSLKIVNQAIENHESFGKFGIKMSANIGAMLVSSKGESLFEIGILPLLLERHQLILRRLEEFDVRESLTPDQSGITKSYIKAELTKIARAEVNRRLWIVIGIMTILWVVMFFLIEKFGWNLLEPWTYLIGIGLAIVGYVYFAVQQREFSPYAIYQQALESRKKRLFQIFGVEE